MRALIVWLRENLKLLCSKLSAGLRCPLKTESCAACDRGEAHAVAPSRPFVTTTSRPPATTQGETPIERDEGAGEGGVHAAQGLQGKT